MKKTRSTIALCFLFTIAILIAGYFSFGIWTTLVFMSGFLGGFILWLVMPMKIAFSQIKAPYWIVLTLFILHRVEENVFRFQEELAKITGTAVPKLTSIPLIILVLISVGSWFFIPLLINLKYAFGYYLAWTFFAAMGITELAHFVFPFFTNEPYDYFPGMLTVVALAPAAWWGMMRLAKPKSN